jgi:hypothetical protein
VAAMQIWSCNALDSLPRSVHLLAYRARIAAPKPSAPAPKETPMTPAPLAGAEVAAGSEAAGVDAPAPVAEGDASAVPVVVVDDSSPWE